MFIYNAKKLIILPNSSKKPTKELYTKPKTQSEPSSTGCKTKTTNPDFNIVECMN
jgi:hypothetical protein